jgi:hypothetical protein
MVKNFLVTYGGLDSLAGINAGSYDNIRLQSGTSEVNGLSPTYPPTHPWRHVKEAAAIPQDDTDSWWMNSAVCFHFGEAITDQHKAAGKVPPTIGLISTAIGGSQIEEWITTEVASECFGFEHNANGGFLNHVCWDSNVRPFLDMTIKGALCKFTCATSARGMASHPPTAACRPPCFADHLPSSQITKERITRELYTATQRSRSATPA